jgi:MFS family permease
MKSPLSEKNKIFIYMLVAMVLGYLPWYNFSAVSKYIAAEFSLTVNQTGIILSSFQAGYVIVVLITGWLADRIGEKKGGCLGYIMYSYIFHIVCIFG